MKRIIALLLSLVTLTATLGAGTVAAEEEDYTHYLNFVQKLKIIEDVSVPKATVTRGQFATFLYNILVGGAKKPTSDRFFTDDNFDTLIEIGSSSGGFDDVSQSNEYYAAIKLVNEMGIMNGTGNKTFSPDSEIPFGHVATALVRLLGHSFKAKDGNYLAVAEQLGIYENMSYNPADKIVLGELAHAFYNCFNIDVTAADMKGEHIYFTELEDVNIYQEFMGVYSTKGQLTKNPYTSIYGDTNVSEDTVVIDGIKYTADDNYALYDLIGRDVEVYYKEDKYGERTLLWGYATGRDEAITISADDFISFNPATNEITYYEGEREETETLQVNTNVIYNGVYYNGNYNNDLFEFDNGEITIIRPRTEDDFSIAVINEYKSMKVTRVDVAKKTLYAQQHYKDKVLDYVLRETDIDEWRVQYYLSDGNQADLNSIGVGMVVDVMENGKHFVKVVASNNIIPGVTLKSIGNDGSVDGTEYTFSDGQKFLIPKAYLDALKAGKKEPKIGTTYNVAINSFGKIAYMEEVTTTAGTQIAYVLDLRADEFTEEYAVEYLNSKDEIVLSYIKVGAMVTRDTLSGRESFKMRDYKDFLKITSVDGLEYKGVAHLRINAEGLVTEINLPVNDKKNRDDVFGVMVKDASLKFCTSPRIKYFENIACGTDMVVFGIDETKSESDWENRYNVITFSQFESGKEYPITAYNLNSTSAVANCIEIKMEAATVKERFTYNDDMYIVTDVYEGVYEDESVIMIKTNLLSNSRDTEERLLPAKKDDFVTGTFFDQASGEELKKGDIIYAHIKDGYIKKALVVYRIFTENGEENLLGTSGKYEPLVDSKTNPYGINTDLTLYADKYPTDSVVNRVNSHPQHRFIAANLYNVELGEYFTYTTQPIDEGRAYEEDFKTVYGDDYLTETMCFPYIYVAIDVDGRNISVRKGTTNDLITYQEAGSGCTQIFMDSEAAAARRLVFINRVD